ncbi:inorganic phosphate transporter [Kerstersia similis]|uniref:inorganic phosphate transporter n=1 Tax=Kerstersia similis TaxID=206505 RepID=UPI0039EE8FAC
MSASPLHAKPVDDTVGSWRISVFFAVLLVSITGYFIYWALGFTNFNQPVLLILAILFGIFMAFNIGGNDVANSFGTSVGARTLTVKQALLIAAVFEVSGAVLAGGEVTATIRGGIVDMSAMHLEPLQLVYIMMSALCAAAIWLLYASKKGYPVSTTHSIVGAIVGSSITLGIMLNGGGAALDLVQWDKIGTIVASWIVSPLLGGVVAYLLYKQVKHHVLNYNETADAQLRENRRARRDYKKQHKEAFERLSDLQKASYSRLLEQDAQLMEDGEYEPEHLQSDYYRGLHQFEQRKEEIRAYRALENGVPLIAALGAVVIASMLLFKGLKNANLGLSSLHMYVLIGMIGAFVWMATFIFAKTLKRKSLSKSTFMMFSWMQLFTAAAFAFSHGSNDISNAIGPFAAILDVLRTGVIGEAAAIPTEAMLTFGVALVVGLWFIGKEVIATVGTNLTKMHPASGFSAELAAAAVVMMASLMGLPVSSTHILIGAVLGIGLANRQTNWGLMKPIAMAWVITLPAAAILSSIIFVILNSVF